MCTQRESNFLASNECPHTHTHHAANTCTRDFFPDHFQTNKQPECVPHESSGIIIADTGTNGYTNRSVL
jgi:hypothetical protein